MEMEHCWWTKPLATDIYNTLRNREMALPTFRGQSPQLAQRRYMVDWLAMIWEKYQLCATSRQLAVTLMDYFMDQFDIETKQLYLVALGCLLVACKFEELETNIPRVVDLDKQVPQPGFTAQQYLQVELLLLDFFKWNVSLPTSAHFTDFYLQYALEKVNIVNGKEMAASKRLQDHLNKYTTYFLEISMQDHYYRDFRPSRLAVACVVASRICLNFTPVLNEKLEKNSMYTWSQLSSIVMTMLRTHHEDEQQSVALTIPPTPPPTPKQKTSAKSKQRPHWISPPESVCSGSLLLESDLVI